MNPAAFQGHQIHQHCRDTNPAVPGDLLGANRSSQISRSWFKAQGSDASLLSQPQPALTPARCFSLLELSQLSEPHPWGVWELDKPLLKLLGMKPLQPCCNNAALSQSIPHRLPRQAVHPSLPPCQPPRPWHHAGQDTAGRAGGCPVCPWRHQELQMCAGEAAWLSHQGCVRREFWCFSSLWHRGKCISPPSVGWALRAQPLSCFSRDFSYSCCTEQNQSNTRQGNINTRNLGPS